ncbi:MAG TPA: COX15/CtaA family protein, partial [Flavobacteriales bacterium]|nr:COX15/CtaA family protein [Flavobacteriales bacterium]
ALDLVDHKEGVQFIHRNLAWLVAAAFLVFAYRERQNAALYGAGGWLALAVVLQFILGVLTLVMQVPIVLGVLHQFGAVLLLVALLNVLHRTGRAPIAGSA